MTLRALRVARTLRHQRMPFDEIRAVLLSDDPVVVHRYLELQQERLAERFEDQRRTTAALERVLTEGVSRRVARRRGARASRLPL